MILRIYAIRYFFINLHAMWTVQAIGNGSLIFKKVIIFIFKYGTPTLLKTRSDKT